MVYLELFWIFIRVCLCTLGGGYSSLPLIESLVVNEHQWLTISEYMDVISISEMTPGAYLINYATFVGLKVGGVLGAVCATLGAVLPSFVIVLILSVLYRKYRNLSIVKGVLGTVRPGVTAIILSAGLSILSLSVFVNTPWSFEISNIDFIAVILFIVSLVTLRKFKLKPIPVILGSGIVGVFLYMCFDKIALQ